MQPATLHLAAILHGADRIALLAADGSEVEGIGRAGVVWNVVGHLATPAAEVRFFARPSGVDTAVRFAVLRGEDAILSAPLRRPQMIPAGVEVYFQPADLAIDAVPRAG